MLASIRTLVAVPFPRLTCAVQSDTFVVELLTLSHNVYDIRFREAMVWLQEEGELKRLSNERYCILKSVLMENALNYLDHF